MPLCPKVWCQAHDAGCRAPQCLLAESSKRRWVSWRVQCEPCTAPRARRVRIGARSFHSYGLTRKENLSVRLPSQPHTVVSLFGACVSYFCIFWFVVGSLLSEEEGWAGACAHVCQLSRKGEPLKPFSVKPFCYRVCFRILCA